MLTIETGAGLANADSLVTLAEVRAYAESRGKNVSVDDAILETQIRIAHDYLLQFESRWKGYRRTEGQALFYPRVGVAVYGRLLEDGTIPVGLKNAIAQLVIEQEFTPDLVPVSEQVVKSEKVGPIETEYVDPVISTTAQAYPRVMSLLEPLFKGGMALISTRV